MVGIFHGGRLTRQPFEKVVVEVLLQRTTATAVSRFYDAFIARFPSWQVLALSEVQDLEAFLKPLGLWRRRAISLLGLARYASANEGKFPADPAEHKAIPAAGQYVSNAILSFQHGKPMPLLDVNMARVIERFLRPRRLADIRHDPWLQAAASYLVRAQDAERANWATLDFASMVCRVGRPLCESCPVQLRCSFRKANRIASANATTGEKSSYLFNRRRFNRQIMPPTLDSATSAAFMSSAIAKFSCPVSSCNERQTSGECRASMIM